MFTMDTSNNSSTSDIEYHEVGLEVALALHAVYSNDVETLKYLIRKYPENNYDDNASHLLHIAVKERKVDSFNYLISLADINLESHIVDGETPLILACQHENSYFAKRLIQNGADVNHRTARGDSPLHYALKNCLETAEVLLENGADVNYMSLDSHIFYRQTPLDVACSNNNYDAIHMLVYYGAVVSLVPLSTLTEFMVKAPLDCLETLLLYYLDEIERVDLNFISMIVRRKFELFPVVLEKIKEVDCDSGELTSNIYDVEQLMALLKKFTEFREYFLEESLVSPYILDDSASLKRFTQLVFKLAEESLLCSDYLETIHGIIACIVACYKEFNICKVELTELILILVSYGLPVNFEDFLQVQSYFGNGFLVKLFLHNTMVKFPLLGLETEWLVQSPDLMSVLLYKPNFDFNCIFESYYCNYYYYDLMNGVMFESLNPISTFRYFANSKFHKFLSKVYPRNTKVYELIQKRHFPRLTELSRNACQNFIYSKYKISDEKPGKYYDIVKRLPIYNYCKQILTFEMELYSV